MLIRNSHLIQPPPARSPPEARDPGSKRRRIGLPLVAVAAAHRDRVLLVVELREVLGVDFVEHGDHDARGLLGGVVIGYIVRLLGLRILGVAVIALHAEFLPVAVHEDLDVGGGAVLRQDP